MAWRLEICYNLRQVLIALLVLSVAQLVVDGLQVLKVKVPAQERLRLIVCLSSFLSINYLSIYLHILNMIPINHSSFLCLSALCR